MVLFRRYEGRGDAFRAAARSGLALGALILCAAAAPTEPSREKPQSQAQTQANAATAQHKPAESFWERTTEDPVALYTGFLAIFTLALVGVSAIQIAFLIKADNRAAEADNRAANANDVATKQVEMLGRQAEIAERQQGLLNAQYFAQHRPRLVVRQVFFTTANDQFCIHLDIVNEGGSAGAIIESRMNIDFIADEPRFRNPPSKELPPISKFVINSGAVRSVNIPCPRDIEEYIHKLEVAMLFPDSKRFKSEDVIVPFHPLYFWGVIQYVDERGEEFGIKRLTIFRRQWNVGDFRFERTGDPDHEYAP